MKIIVLLCSFMEQSRTKSGKLLSDISSLFFISTRHKQDLTQSQLIPIHSVPWAFEWDWRQSSTKHSTIIFHTPVHRQEVTTLLKTLLLCLPKPRGLNHKIGLNLEGNWLENEIIFAIENPSLLTKFFLLSYLSVLCFPCQEAPDLGNRRALG